MRQAVAASLIAVAFLAVGSSRADDAERLLHRDVMSPRQFIVGKWYKKCASGIDAAWEFTTDGRLFMKVGRGARWIDYGSENTYRYVDDGHLYVIEKDPEIGTTQRVVRNIKVITPNEFSLFAGEEEGEETFKRVN